MIYLVLYLVNSWASNELSASDVLVHKLFSVRCWMCYDYL